MAGDGECNTNRIVGARNPSRREQVDDGHSTTQRPLQVTTAPNNASREKFGTGKAANLFVPDRHEREGERSIRGATDRRSSAHMPS